MNTFFTTSLSSTCVIPRFTIRLATKFLRFFEKYRTALLKVLAVSIVRAYIEGVTIVQTHVYRSLWMHTNAQKWTPFVERFWRFYFMNSVWVTKWLNQRTKYAVRWGRVRCLFARRDIDSISFATENISSKMNIGIKLISTFSSSWSNKIHA